jgi:uncharacterized membrane protein YdbT with pleckstrin-like domain
MGTYADSLLTQGEEVLRRERQHWLSLFLESRLAILLWGVGLIVLLMIVVFDLRDAARDGLGVAAMAVILAGLVVFAFRWWHWITDEYIITNRRLLKVEGIINKHSADSSLEKINDAILEQNVVARLLDYGDLDILTAAEVAVDRYRMLNHAKTFKKEMLTAKHDLEMGHAGAPMSSTDVAETAARAAALGGAADRRAETTEQIAQSLARIASLRDSGAITGDEYEAKKQELLDRL